ncbi:hypothetical protein Tco_0218238 [Tanacetum coccineum]
MRSQGELSQTCFKSEGSVDQHAKQHEDERVLLASLIENLKFDIDENKNINKELKKANTFLTHERKDSNIELASFSVRRENCQCKRLETKLSKRHKHKPDKDFANLEQDYINLELSLQHAKEKYVYENSWEKKCLTSEDNEKV